jgi:hypothetical protein
MSRGGGPCYGPGEPASAWPVMASAGHQTGRSACVRISRCADASPADPERRTLFRLTAATGASLLARDLIMPVQAATPPSERTEAIRPQPDAAPSGQDNTADIIVETLISWQVPFVFGLVGDGINSFIEALRKRQDRIRFVGVRHEDPPPSWPLRTPNTPAGSAFCLATTGPGAIHLRNGGCGLASRREQPLPSWGVPRAPSRSGSRE